MPRSTSGTPMPTKHDDRQAPGKNHQPSRSGAFASQPYTGSPGTTPHRAGAPVLAVAGSAKGGCSHGARSSGGAQAVGATEINHTNAAAAGQMKNVLFYPC